ncbi:MAG: hypothetical protein IJ581_02235 [Paludibacteraceae bacterium]|nr:hypothetical protein [Paludibacteraceae bacterium]
MIVRIDKNVHVQIAEFYAVSMTLHPTLDEATVKRKKERLYAALRELGSFATIYPPARYKQAWIDAGYHEFIAEDFHFAYTIYTVQETGESVAYVIDACHSLLYHN